MKNEETAERLWHRLRSILERLAKKRGMPKAQLARNLGLQPKHFSNQLSGTVDAEISLSRYSMALSALGIDLPALIEAEAFGADAQDLSALPAGVQAFLQGPNANRFATDDEREAIYWLAKTGFFAPTATEKDIEAFWHLLRDHSEKKRPPSWPPPKDK